jgi:hypothetical protein
MRTEIEKGEIDRLYDHVARGFARAMTFPTVEHDFTKRRRYVAVADDPAWIYRDAPTYDPRFNALDGRNGFWLNVRRLGARGADGEREMIAHCAVRVWRDARIADLFVDSRFIQEQDSGHAVSFDPVEARHVGGSLAYIGGAWVHPDFRHRRLPALLMAFAQLHLLEHYDCDYALGLIDDKAAQAGMGARAWRFHHHHRGVTWSWPGVGKIPMWLIYNNRDDMLEELRAFAVELSEPEPRPALRKTA